MILTQEDLNKLAQLIQDGNTSGLLDGETEAGEQTRISWELKTDKFINS